jgi:predicted nucleic acid-binding protein
VRTLVDSSGWIEFFAEGPLADRYAPYLRTPAQLVTPTIVLYEVYKRLKQERGEDLALFATEQIRATQIIPLTESLALLAADVSLEYGLAMADAVVYATARDQDARLVTSDADFKTLPAVEYVR